MKRTIEPKLYRKLLIQTGEQKVAELFFIFPDKEFSLSEVAKETGVAKANLGKILKKFEKEELISIEKLSKIWRIKANRENKTFIGNKIIYNLNFIYQSGLIEFLYDYYEHPMSIIIFGSFRKGEDVSSSDVDIAIEIDDAKEFNTRHLHELANFEGSIGRKIQIHEFSKRGVDINLFNNIANGIVLAGFLEVNK